MRKDLNKQLCERERSGSRYYKFGRVRRDKGYAVDLREDGSNHIREGMKRRYGYDTKNFSENLTPLEGALRKAIGRRWDSFYSDLCKNFDMSTEINKHILQHLEQFCERNVVMKAGALTVRGGKYGAADYPLFGSNVRIYVDPRDGIIRRNKYHLTYRQQEKARREQDTSNRYYKVIDNDHVLRNEAGIWFIYTLAEIPGGGTYQTRTDGVVVFIPTRVQDVFTKGFVKRTPHETRYHASRRSAGKKLLRSFNL